MEINTEKKKTLFGYSRQLLPVISSINTKVVSEVTKQAKMLEFQVAQDNAETLLSCDTSEELGLVKFARSVTHSTTESLLQEYQDRFSGMGKMTNTDVKLHINDNIQPIQQKLRRVPFHLMNDLEAELNRLEDLDIIEIADGPTTWVSPIVVVPKAKVVRICIDSRAINTAIEGEREVIPTLDDLKKDLNGAKIF